MKKLLLFLLLCSISSAVFAYGSSGTYSVSGIMLDRKTKQPLRNATIIIRASAKQVFVNDTIVTDSEGKFSYKMEWISPCVSGLRPAAIRRKRKHANPKQLSIIYHNKIQRIANEWKKYNHSTEAYFVTLYW